MNIEDLKALAESGDADALETEWMEAMEADTPAEELAPVLKKLVEADELNTAETLGWALLAERAEKLPDERALDEAEAVVTAVPKSDELRAQAGEVLRRVYGEHEHFEPIFESAGLLSGQSPRRAFRTLRTCLSVQPGDYMVNRFDHGVVRVGGFDEVLKEFELTDSAGGTSRMDCKNLADEFDLADAEDFRVLCQYRTDRLGELLESDPLGLLIGLCRSHGGSIDAEQLKEELVPKHISAKQWSSWWNRARTAAKKSQYLTLEGRPIVVTYHPGGKSLEEELAGDAEAARMPMDKLDLLKRYVREASARKVPVQENFVRPVIESLARQAREFAEHRPTDALTAALATKAAERLGLPKAEQPCPSAEDILAASQNPAETVVSLEPELIPPAIEALCSRDDAAERLVKLLPLLSADHLDDVTARLRSAGREDAVDAIVTEALKDPQKHPEVAIWLWKGPRQPVNAAPGKVELLSRLLTMMQHLARDEQVDRAHRKDIFQKVRSALSAESFASYKQALEEMDEDVAATIKPLVQRCDGLAQAVRGEMLQLLRDKFPTLWISRRVEPWLDESTIYTTQAAMDRRLAELKRLAEVEIPDNSRRIGEAASHGDLSENAEWSFAMEERDLLRRRQAKMQDELSRARVIHPDEVSTNMVGIGSKVRLRRLDEGREIDVSFLGPWDTDVANRIFSYQTQLARELMGKNVGDEVELKLEGEEATYRIEEISSALS
ncbi:MAG: GreA/GreB family elongation factor [Planctomycetota bacterium]